MVLTRTKCCKIHISLLTLSPACVASFCQKTGVIPIIKPPVDDASDHTVVGLPSSRDIRHGWLPYSNNDVVGVHLG